MYLRNPAHRYMYLRVWSIVSTYIYLRASASIGLYSLKYLWC